MGTCCIAICVVLCHVVLLSRTKWVISEVKTSYHQITRTQSVLCCVMLLLMQCIFVNHYNTMWFWLCHVDIDIMYFCKSLEHNVVCVVSEKAASENIFGFHHLASRPGTAQMIIILRHTKKIKFVVLHVFV